MILKQLKEQTRMQHERLESRLDLLNRVVNIDEYRMLLERFYGFYEPIESIIAAERFEDSDFDFNARRKFPLLVKDLTVLGLSDEQIVNLPVCDDQPDISTLAKVFGYLYVAEGSTLGGQIISRHFAQTLQIEGDHGGAFFSAYGVETGKMWRSFQLAITDFNEKKSKDDEIIGAAIETFEALENWLFQK